MKQKAAFAILFLITLLFSQVSLAVSSSPAQQVVETIVQKAKDLDQKATRNLNEKTIESLVDFRKLALDSLGRHADSISASQKGEVQELLRKIITKTVYPEAPKFFQNVKIQYTDEKQDDDKTHITSLVTKGTKRSTVEFWLQPQADSKKYLVTDLAIEGERWVENVRDQFDEVIRKYGVNGLISKMKKRLSQLQNNS